MKLKMGLEYSDTPSCFELKLFSKASEKFLIGVRDMFLVCKTLSQIGGTQRSLNQNRSTSHTFHFYKSINPP
eukprot:UN14760